MKNFEIKLKISGLLKSWSWSIFLKIFNVIFKQAKLNITMIFSTTKYFSIILQSISHKAVKIANIFDPYMSLEKSFKKTTSIAMILYWKVGKNRQRSCFLLKSRQFSKLFLGSNNNQNDLLLWLSYVKYFEE